MVGSVHLLAARIRGLSYHHGHGILQRKVQDGLGGKLDMLALGGGLHAAPQAAAGGGADGRAFAAAGDAADDGANRCPGAYLLGRVLAARTALAAVLIGLDVVGLAAD